MKPSTFALPTLLILSSSTTSAFTGPQSSTFVARNTMQYVSSTSHIHPTISTSLSGSTVGSSTSLSAYLGQNFDEPPSSIDNNNENQDTASNYVQSLSPEERNENLKVMRQIFNHDLADLQRRRDYAGWVEAKRDLRERQAKDPWFELNTKLKEAVQMGEIEECDRLKILIQKVSIYECV